MRTSRTYVRMLLAVALLAVAPTVAGAEVRPEWRREPGGTPVAVTTDAVGNVYVTGQIWAPPAEGDRFHRHAMVVAKYGPAGGLAWRRTWRVRDAGWWANGRAVTPAPGGGVYVGGTSGWYEDDYPVVWRYSASGRLLWRRTLDISIARADVVSVAADVRGVVAAVQSVGSCCDDVAHDGGIQALDPAGWAIWRTDFEAPGIAGTWDAIGGVALGADGRVYAAGHVDRGPFTSPDDPAPDEDLVVQQLSRVGDVRWTRVIGDASAKDRESATGVAVRNGLVVVTASIDDETRGWAGALTTQGEWQWRHRWGQRYRTSAVAVAIAPWGPVYVAADHTAFRPGGSMSSTATLRRWAPDGTFVWKRLLAEGEVVRGIAAGDALYLAVGRSLERWPR